VGLNSLKSLTSILTTSSRVKSNFTNKSTYLYMYTVDQPFCLQNHPLHAPLLYFEALKFEPRRQLNSVFSQKTVG
jgi:hypothetical protein